MKKFLLTLFLILLVTTPTAALAVWDQYPRIFQNAATANGNGEEANVAQYSTVGIDITISGTATVTFSAKSSTSGSYANVACTNMADGGSSATATASGHYQCNVSGSSHFRTPITDCAGCTVTVAGRITMALLRGGGSGSGLPSGASEADCLQYLTGVATWGPCPGGAAAAPADAEYWTATANATLSAERNLGLLTTGLVLNTVTAGTGVPSTYPGVTCTAQVLRILSASGAGTCVTITSAYVDTTVWTGTASSGILKASSQGVLATATAGTDYVDIATANSWTDNVKQTFNPGANNAGFNVGAVAVEPDTPVAGDAFYDSATTTFKFYENGSWKGLGVQAEADTLDTAFDRGKIIDGANSLANAVQIGDGSTPVCIYTDATLGPQVRACTDADTKTIIPTNFNWCLYNTEGTECIETVDPDAASTLAMWTYNTSYKPKKSVWFGAGSLSTDGTQCAAPAEATPVASGPKLWTIICTDNDASTITGSIKMPDAWDGGTVTFEHVYIQTAADTSALNGDIAAQCRGNGEALADWATGLSEVAIDDAAVTGSGKNDFTTSGAVTPTGTCAAGDMLYFRYQLDATGTTTAVATLHHVGFKMEYSVTSRSD